MPSIFPQVTVTIVKPLQAGTKQVQPMSVGLIGPMFKRLSETKVNGYAVNPDIDEKISVTLDNPSDSQYIDYDSVEAQLAVTGTDEVIQLNNVDKEVIGSHQVVQSNLTIDSSLLGFYLVLNGESVFYPSTGMDTTYNAQPGDFLYLKTSTADYFHKIKKVTPTQLTSNNFPIPTTTFNTGTGVFTWSAGVANKFIDPLGSGTFTPTHNYLVLVNKLNREDIHQALITEIVNGGTGSPSTITVDITGLAVNGCTENFLNTTINPVSAWDYYIYDMPIGSIVTYNSTTTNSSAYVNVGTTYKILDYNYLVSNQGASSGKFGRFVTVATSNEQIFLPDKRTMADYFGSKKGDYLRATNKTSGDIIDFRIIDNQSTVHTSLAKVKNFSVKVASTANFTLSGTSRSTTVDGVNNVADNDLILLKDQTNAAENGIYYFKANAAMTNQRFTGFDAVNSEEIHDGAIISVREGTIAANKAYSVTLENGSAFILGTDDITLTVVASPATHIYEIPEALDSSTYDVNKLFLVARLKNDPEIMRIFKVTSVSGAALRVNGIDFSTDGAGANNAVIATDFANWDWKLHRTPPNSLLVSDSTLHFLAVTGNATGSSNITAWDFSVVNKADYHITGRNEVTISNHIADQDNIEIGLADIIFNYNVLETESAGQMWDIVTQEDRDLVCGEVANYNPLGLAAGLVEINTLASYKVIPCDLALSERDPDNPKPYVGEFKVGKKNPNYHDIKKLDWIGAYDILGAVKDTQIPYYIIPLSQDASITGLSVATITELAEPKKMKEMVTFITSPLIESDGIVTNINLNINDFLITGGKIRYTPSSVYISASDSKKPIDFLSLGIRKGDYLVGKLTGTNGEEDLKFKIVNIYSNFLDLGSTDETSTTDLIANFDNNYRLEIRRYFNNKTQQAEALAKKSSSYASFRVKFLWGDLCDLEIEGVTFTSVPSYYAAAAYAAMANNKGVVSPKTNWPINGLTKVYNVSPKFGINDLELMGEGFMDILAQDFDGGPVFSKRQFMTDGSELSGVEVVDELAKYIRILFRPYLGKYNIDIPLFDVLGIVLSTILTTYVPRKLNALAVVKPFTVSGPNSDRLSLTLRPETKKPFNGLDVEIQVA